MIRRRLWQAAAVGAIAMSGLDPDEDPWAPDRPSAARMYDYYLGGSHHFAIDRQMADQAIALWPDLPRLMATNRAFMYRAVRYLSAQGVDQFLDIGSGLPTVGNVHEIAKHANPLAHVVYVDIDRMAVALARDILKDEAHVIAVEGDVRVPNRILQSYEVRRQLDFNQPIGLLLVALLHFIVDDEVAVESVRTLTNALAPGSYLVITHATNETRPELAREHEQLYARTPTPLKMRTRAGIAEFFRGLELVEPGLVFMPLWRPDGSYDEFRDDPERSSRFACMGRKPA
jgi:S-adenosyl methyltransferase